MDRLKLLALRLANAPGMFLKFHACVNDADPAKSSVAGADRADQIAWNNQMHFEG